MKRLLFIVGLLAAVAAELPAQVKSLKSCLETGLQNNYSLRIVRNEERIAANNATKANAGYLPKVDLTAGYSGTLDSRNTRAAGSGGVTRERNIMDGAVNAGVTAEWTIFDGYGIQTNYQRLVELKKQGATQTRIAIEDYLAELTAEYFNFVQQKLRLKNLSYGVALSKERLRIVQERYLIGNTSRLDLQQAQVDFNADSAQSLQQLELLATSRIRLNELMAMRDMDRLLLVRDTAIDVSAQLNFDSLWSATLRNNASLLNAAHGKRLAELDLKTVLSRNYPYVNLNAVYGYTFNHYGNGATQRRHNWGADFGVTVGFNLFDGNRKRERRNAQIAIENAELERENLEITLRANLADLWQAYQNNKRLLALERENLIAARENHFIAHERYMLGDLSGIEMREAQKSLLDAEERILVAQYNTKLCEISLLQVSGNIMHYLD